MERFFFKSNRFKRERTNLYAFQNKLDNGILHCFKTKEHNIKFGTYNNNKINKLYAYIQILVMIIKRQQNGEYKI